MRCKRCGAEITEGALCDFCREVMATGQPRRDSSLWSWFTASFIALGVLILVLPVFMGCKDPREHAGKTKSINNIKQLVIAVATYTQDYNETLPGWVRNPDGSYAHNTWDEQIDGQIKDRRAFFNDKTGIRSYSQSGTHDRVIGYGLNGLLITGEDSGGSANFDTVNVKDGPHPMATSGIPNTSATILFAELSTRSRFPGVYGTPPNPKPYTWSDGPSTKEWKDALDGWIDISPRDWVETGGANGSYHEPYPKGVADYGVARDLYNGGGNYAFCDGHAAFMKISETVGIGTTTKKGLTITEYNCWSKGNTNNRWVPR